MVVLLLASLLDYMHGQENEAGRIEVVSLWHWELSGRGPMGLSRKPRLIGRWMAQVTCYCVGQNHQGKHYYHQYQDYAVSKVGGLKKQEAIASCPAPECGLVTSGASYEHHNGAS